MDSPGVACDDDHRWSFQAEACQVRAPPESVARSCVCSRYDDPSRQSGPSRSSRIVGDVPVLLAGRPYHLLLSIHVDHEFSPWCMFPHPPTYGTGRNTIKSSRIWRQYSNNRRRCETAKHSGTLHSTYYVDRPHPHRPRERLEMGPALQTGFWGDSSRPGVTMTPLRKFHQGPLSGLPSCR